jgi:serine/threonine protein kinase
MSPQILNHEPYTAKTDVWSMAFIIYESLYQRSKLLLIPAKAPWNGKTMAELYKNISTYPLSFNDYFQVSEGVRNFLRQCLGRKESERLSWEDIYRHELFGTEFSDYLKKFRELEVRALYLINDIRQEVVFNQLDIEQLFQELDESQD